MWWVITGFIAGIFQGIHNIFVSEIREAKGSMTICYTASGIIFIYFLRFIMLKQEGIKCKFTPLNVTFPNCIIGAISDLLVA